MLLCQRLGLPGDLFWIKALLLYKDWLFSIMDHENFSINRLLELPQPAVFYFYGYWQFILCLFSAIALFGIWWHIGRKAKDNGLIWLSLAILCWSLSGFVEIYYANNLDLGIREYWQEGKDIKALLGPVETKVESGRSILSLFNSVLILLALPCFRHIPKPIEPIILSPSWRFIVVGPFLISISVNIGILLGVFSTTQTKFINSFDFVYAILITLPFLGWVLWASFAKRNLKILAWLSLICIALILIAQISKLNEDYLFKVISSSTFKPMLIMLFFALALSWVKELAEHPLPGPNQMQLSFFRLKTDSGRIENQIQLSVPPLIKEQKITLTKSRFQLLNKFARNLHSDNPWLEIKPKNETRTNKLYDVNDHNEIKRLIINILDEALGKNNWNATVDRPYLKDALFEFSDQEKRKVKLRITPQNIEFNQD